MSLPTLPLDIKRDFPLLSNPKLASTFHYLDNAATTHKPEMVTRAMDDFYRFGYGTVRRGVYKLSEGATANYEGTRKKIANLIGAESSEEIVYTSGSTQSINLVAYTYGRKFIGKGDEIILSQIEHHANIVPWQMVAEEVGAKILVIPCNDRGELDMEAYAKLLSRKTKLVGVNHISNALGTLNPIQKIAAMAHTVGAVILVDGAQSVAHCHVNVKELGADFFVFSGHKIFGPTGIGALWGRMELLDRMPPYQRGGDMIQTVTFEKSTFQSPPHRFEAGTPPIAEVVGLSSALDYVTGIGLDRISEHEQLLLNYATKKLSDIKGLTIIGQAKEKASILSFVLEGIHPHDIGTVLDQEGVAIRAGHHCAQPTMQRFNVPATARISLGPYNDYSDIDAAEKAIRKTLEVFG